jgi:hypothetical protein
VGKGGREGNRHTDVNLVGKNSKRRKRSTSVSDELVENIHEAGSFCA